MQPADTTWANKELNRLLRDAMRKRKIEEVQAGRKVKYFSSLTKEGRLYLGSFLSEMKEKWNENKGRRDGVKKSFRRTMLQ